MADPLRAALRVVRERLGDDGVRELVMAAVAAALDDVLSPVRTPARRSPARVENDAPVDELTAERARRNAMRVLG